MLRQERGLVVVHRELVRDPSLLGVWLSCEGIEECRDGVVEVLHVALLAQRGARVVGFGAHIHTRAALAEEVAQTAEALVAAGAVLEVALAGLRQHALADHAGAHSFVAARRNVRQVQGS